MPAQKARTALKSKAFSFTDLDGAQHLLTPLQKKWADAYIGKAMFSRTDASFLAGYICKNRNTAGAIGGENLQKPTIRAYIDKKLDDAGYNDTVVDRELLLAIRQTDQWGAKVSAIREYNDIKGRHAPEKVEGKVKVVRVGVWKVEKGDRDRD